jgi:hypothetical protein
MANDPGSAVIVRSAVDLGHNLGMTVVAEGVQDATARSDLAEMGCDLVQGYEICRPIPARELELWIETHLVTNPSAPPSVPAQKVPGRSRVESPGHGQLESLRERRGFHSAHCPSADGLLGLSLADMSCRLWGAL